VGMTHHETAIRVCDSIRLFLPILLALVHLHIMKALTPGSILTGPNFLRPFLWQVCPINLKTGINTWRWSNCSRTQV
jgi:hypothetical protein